ncbi:MAG: hypothetical protein ACK4RF_10150 [Cyclobacteriaceae bacterium]
MQILEKNFPLIVSLLSLVIVLGYVRYSNDRVKNILAETAHNKQHEEGVLPPSQSDAEIPRYLAV